MPYCSNCGTLVGDEASYCSNCGKPLTGGGTGQVSARGRLADLDTVPSWLGWLALPIAILTSIIGLGLYSYWAFRRGRREGVGLDPTAEPYDNFAWRVLGWGVAGFVPILGLYAVFHLPTICYKEGLRVGAKGKAAFEGFTSLPALAAAFGGMVVVVLAALFITGLTLAIVESENGDEPVRIIPTSDDEPIRVIPTLSPRPTPTRSPLLEFTECLVIAKTRGYDVTPLSASYDFANRDGTISDAEAIFLRDLCNEAIRR